jgi:nicotinamide riboside transporter PnuC
MTWTWLLTLLSVIGVILNIQKKRSSFYIWAGTNACWAVVDYAHGLYSQSALFAIYFCLSVWGIIAWRTR